MQKLQL